MAATFAPVLYDRVMETTTTTGTGTLTLAGAVTGYQSFAVVGNGNTVAYSLWAVDANGAPTGDWETGYGVYSSGGTTLTRATITASSNSGSAVNLSAGTKRVAGAAIALHQQVIDPGFLYTSPSSLSWSWVNQGSATISTVGNGFLGLNGPGQGSLSLRCRVKSLAASSNYTLTACLFFSGQLSQSLDNFGILLRDSATGKMVTLTFQYSGTAGETLALGGFAFTNATTFSTTYFQQNVWPSSPVWLRFVDDGANRKYQYSTDGISFSTMFSHGRTTFITPDQAGFYVDPENASSVDANLTLVSWTEV